MATMVSEIPNIFIDGYKIPEEVLKKANKIVLIKECTSVDRVVITLCGKNIDIGDLRAKEIEIEGKKYILTEVKDDG